MSITDSIPPSRENRATPFDLSEFLDILKAGNNTGFGPPRPRAPANAIYRNGIDAHDDRRGLAKAKPVRTDGVDIIIDEADPDEPKPLANGHDGDQGRKQGEGEPKNESFSNKDRLSLTTATPPGASRGHIESAAATDGDDDDDWTVDDPIIDEADLDRDDPVRPFTFSGTPNPEFDWLDADEPEPPPVIVPPEHIMEVWPGDDELPPRPPSSSPRTNGHAQDGSHGSQPNVASSTIGDDDDDNVPNENIYRPHDSPSAKDQSQTNGHNRNEADDERRSFTTAIPRGSYYMHIGNVARTLLGAPTRATPTELRYGNAGSLSVNLTGPFAGRYKSWKKEPDKGDVLDLIVRQKKISNAKTRSEAEHWLRKQIKAGFPDAAPGLTEAHYYTSDGQKRSMFDDDVWVVRVGSWLYRNEMGMPVYTKVRYDRYSRHDGKPIIKKNGKIDKFYYFENSNQPGSKNPMDGVARVPYGLPQLLNDVEKDQWIFVPEGEKHVDALLKLGFAATTARPWHDDVTPWLKGTKEYQWAAKGYILLPDNDEPGREYARDVSRRLTAIGVPVKILALPGLGEGEDIIDWLATEQRAGDPEVASEELHHLIKTLAVDPEEAANTGPANPPNREPFRWFPDDPAGAAPWPERREIELVSSHLPANVNEAEQALIEQGVDIFQQGDRIVSLAASENPTHDEDQTTASRLVDVPKEALVEHMMRAADFMKMDGRAKVLKATKCPQEIALTYMARHGRRNLRRMTGIINSPTMRRDGSILDQRGYDATTGLFYDPGQTTFPPIPSRPFRDDGIAALGELKGLIGTFPFATPESKAVALSAILTTAVRRLLPTAPMHGFSAPTPSSGKTKLVNIAALIATGREAKTTTQSNEEETEKRLASLFLAGHAAILLDNCTLPVGGDALCAMLTSEKYAVRVLGKSEMREVHTNAMMFATGNNLVIKDDMNRRSLVCTIDPKVERPELRKFRNDPQKDAQRDRGRYLAAIITILRSHVLAGRPQMATPLGSFEMWSTWVRDPLMWLNEPDPCATMEATRANDPGYEKLAPLIHHWHAVLGERRVTVNHVVKAAHEGSDNLRARQSLTDALMAVAADDKGGGINTKRLGNYLKRNAGKVIGEYRVIPDGILHGDKLWRLEHVPAPTL